MSHLAAMPMPIPVGGHSRTPSAGSPYYFPTAQPSPVSSLASHSPGGHSRTSSASSGYLQYPPAHVHPASSPLPSTLHYHPSPTRLIVPIPSHATGSHHSSPSWQQQVLQTPRQYLQQPMPVHHTGTSPPKNNSPSWPYQVALPPQQAVHHHQQQQQQPQPLPHPQQPLPTRVIYVPQQQQQPRMGQQRQPQHPIAYRPPPTIQPVRRRQTWGSRPQSSIVVVVHGTGSSTGQTTTTSSSNLSPIRPTIARSASTAATVGSNTSYLGHPPNPVPRPPTIPPPQHRSRTSSFGTLFGRHHPHDSDDDDNEVEEDSGGALSPKGKSGKVRKVAPTKSALHNPTSSRVRPTTKKVRFTLEGVPISVRVRSMLDLSLPKSRIDKQQSKF